MRKIKSWQTTGPDSISVELLEAVGLCRVNRIIILLNEI